VHLDESALRQMLAESAAAGVTAAGAERVVLDRTRVLSEHGVTSNEGAAEFDHFVLGHGGTLRRARSRHGTARGADHCYWRRRPAVSRLRQ
jgi:hypothetical protein